MVVKNNGTKVTKSEFDASKVEASIKKANLHSESKQLRPSDIKEIAEYVEFKYRKISDENGEQGDITVDDLKKMIEVMIMSKGAFEVAITYDRCCSGRMNKHDIEEIDKEGNHKALLSSKLKIRKKNGTLENYDERKLLAAIRQSAVRARDGGDLNDEEKETLIALVEAELAEKVEEKFIPSSTMHFLVEKYLDKVAPDVGKTYTNYHSFRMGQAELWEQIMGQCTTLIGNERDNETMFQKHQNANADSTLSSTQKCFFADYTAEQYYERFFLTKLERQIAKDGFLYWHDKNARIIYALNCCLFRIAYVLEHGFAMNGIWYNPPKSLVTCFKVIGDVVLMSASQQYGGFTVPRIDSILAPYAEMSYKKKYDRYISKGISPEQADEMAMEEIQEEMEEGFQGLEYKFNTVASSRGDYPFTTVTFGLDTSRFGKMASKACLKVRAKGQGAEGKKKPVLFPKLVFLFDKNLHSEGCENYDVFEAGIECSSKTMYPDWLSLTGEGYVPSMYKKYGVDGVISPMGCRAFLSPYYERGGFEPADENDKPVFEGRFNLGVISLNLPMILARAREEDLDFYETLDYYLNVARENHKRTYEFLGHMRASKNPVGFCYGGFYGGNLKPEDEIAPLLKSATMSFGVTALNELQRLYNGHSLFEDNEFALEVMQHINQKIAEFKTEDHILYAVYGTPAESLCNKQVRQFRAKYGIVKDVSDRTYVSNSFHCHVTEKISPIQKQDREKAFWDYFNGGKIQYCRYPVDYNVAAMRSLVLRAMEMGFYEGVNFSLCFCDDCGYQELEMGKKCPKCGGYHITQIDRMNGYLAFTRIGSDTRIETYEDGTTEIIEHNRYSPAKLDEIAERESM